MSSDHEVITINTNYGPVRGSVKSSSCGSFYHEFLAIPFAKIPNGDLRFRDPQPLEPSSNVENNENEFTKAYQFCPETKTVVGSDNCLHLNIFTSTHGSIEMPVIVWIHGENFTSGSNEIEKTPEYFLKNEVIVVAINYRLGVAGFLSFEDESLGIAGNAGLKDQVAALRWIKENIKYFGGDSENITICGGSSVHFHLISPQSEGLFSKAIVHSGSAFNPYSCMSDDSYEHDLARMLDWNGHGGDQGPFKVISSMDIETILMTISEFIENDSHENRLFGSALNSIFLPKIETHTSITCFLPKSVLELGREAWSKNINVIVGGSIPNLNFEKYFEECAPLLQNDFTLSVPLNLRRKINFSEQKTAAEILKQIYFTDKDIQIDRSKFVEIISDLNFWHGIHRMLLQRHFKGGRGKTFHYHLDSNDDFLSSLEISSHDETPHFFTAILGFVKTGDPNPKLEVKWKTIEDKEPKEERFSCMSFSKNQAVSGPSPNGGKMLNLDLIYEKDELI